MNYIRGIPWQDNHGLVFNRVIKALKTLMIIWQVSWQTSKTSSRSSLMKLLIEEIKKATTQVMLQITRTVHHGILK